MVAIVRLWRTYVDRMLKVAEAASYIGLSKSSLDKLRVYGGGPIYIKLGKRVVYDPADLAAWLAARKVAHTSAANDNRPPLRASA
jgi:predicted DNA-binding transcriptional regulator AlpA